MSNEKKPYSSPKIVTLPGLPKTGDALRIDAMERLVENLSKLQRILLAQSTVAIELELPGVSDNLAKIADEIKAESECVVRIIEDSDDGT